MCTLHAVVTNHSISLCVACFHGVCQHCSYCRHTVIRDFIRKGSPVAVTAGCSCLIDFYSKYV